MSTFNGIVTEFPDIRVDFFRRNPNAEPPLACFLSHVHSDHLAGLESLRSPFVYCSAATREILLRLERYPCRINYAKGILEARQQTYKHLAKVLKPLPLETPTTIELHPGREIQVTLFDANHCLGAVMFLIEGNGKAILYTGDIRSEPWFVNSLARSPSLVEYTCGIKTLDKIYLDTSFIRDVPFQTKAEGIAELLRKVSKYPKDTVFHIQAWTYGYEDVWVTLSKALKSPIHVDDYKLRIYGSLRAKASEKRFSNDIHMTPESPALTGYMCGNAPHPGCLAADQHVRLHSCEKGNMCEVAKRPTTVKIQPVIAHLPTGEDLAEVGVGGGGDDLEREAELEYLDQADLSALIAIICSSGDLTEDDREDLKKYLARATSTGRNVSLDIDLASLDEKRSVQDTVQVLVDKLRTLTHQKVAKSGSSDETLPKTIRFPYSRHSSYPELCGLLKVFRPQDVWPCTVNPAEWRNEGTTIRSLFGEYCSGDLFEHDAVMEALFEGLEGGDASELETQLDTQVTASSAPALESSPPPPEVPPRSPDQLPKSSPRQKPAKSMSLEELLLSQRFVSPLPDTQVVTMNPELERENSEFLGHADQIDLAVSKQIQSENNATPRSRKRGIDDLEGVESNRSEPTSQQTNKSFASGLSMRDSPARRDAYLQMMANMDDDNWSPIGLISASAEHTKLDQEL